jgi:hypothetical protein
MVHGCQIGPQNPHLAFQNEKVAGDLAAFAFQAWDRESVF